MKLIVDFDNALMKQSAAQGRSPLFSIYWMHEWMHEQTAYPEAQWLDCGSVVLSWWLVSARALLEGAAEADFSFMEGPFSLTVRRLGNQVTITDPEQTWNTKAPLQGFIGELLTATNQVLGKFAEIGINDQNGLKTGMRQLQATLSQANNAVGTRSVAAVTFSH